MSIQEPRPMKIATRLVAGAFVALSVGSLSPAATGAQEDRYDRGTVGAGLLLRQLDGVKRVLMIGAHPDDEDTALLAALARGRGARTAYLSLTRGDGGQNLIGPELGEGLGAVRTGELLAARALDGGAQYFTRAFDFGFSKTAEEALTLWPRDELLRDVVWVVRTFRPQIVVSVFSGTPADGHGQHQAAGILAREAFDVAGDPSAYPDQLQGGITAWQPDKLYLLARGGRGSPTTFVETGTYDPLLGRSHFQLAMESRSQHRSQDMGVGQPLGPQRSALELLRVSEESGERQPPTEAANRQAGESVFSGLDTALVRLTDGLERSVAGPVATALTEYRSAIADAASMLNALEPATAVAPLARAVREVRRAREALERLQGEDAAGRGRELADVLDERLRGADEALRDAAGVVVDVRVADDLVVPGQDVRVDLEVWNGGPFVVADVEPALDVPEGWSVAPFEGQVRRAGFFAGRGSRVETPGGAATLASGESAVWRWTVSLPPDARPSTPFYLEESREGEMYHWPDDPSVHALPHRPPPIHGRVPLTLRPGSTADPTAAGVAAAGLRLEAHEPARYVGVDEAEGEFEEPMLVVPALSVSTEPGVMVIPTSRPEARPVTVRIAAFADDGAEGTVRLDVPDGWGVDPVSASFRIDGEGEERTFTFTIRPPDDPGPGRFTVRAVAETATGSFSERVELIDYPHIERVAMVAPSETRLTVLPVVVDEGLRVGYVMGSGDAGFAALTELGVAAELLGPDALRDGDLSRFDALVLGIRAYEVRPDLVAASDRVLDFARAGGTVLVQYNRYEFPGGDFAPYPVGMSRPHDRVTDERSPVRLLEPDAPLFNRPNAIDPVEDFAGWVTERGLYFLGTWDDRYTPLLELTDPGEEPKTGAIVAAPVGDGLWVYTGLSFFRQLPEGVPGAYRLFANLISMDRAAWNAWRSGSR